MFKVPVIIPVKSTNNGEIFKVLSETKKALSGQLPSPGRPLVVEISLKTAEGDSMVLEWWRLAVVAGGDPQVYFLLICFIIYFVSIWDIC